MPIGFIRRSSIFGANIIGLHQVAAVVGMIFILTSYFQEVHGYSALSAGVAFALMGGVFLVISGFLSSRLVNRFDVKPILISGDFANIRLSIAFADLSQKATMVDCSGQCSS